MKMLLAVFFLIQSCYAVYYNYCASTGTSCTSFLSTCSNGLTCLYRDSQNLVCCPNASRWCANLDEAGTSISTCASDAAYCTNTLYTSLMKEQCPSTCGYCSSSSISSSTTCVDLLNPDTGVSDCPSRAYLCDDATYYSVMTVQCPATCDRCSSSYDTDYESISTCVDQLNPSTGVSDCPADAYLCTNTAYQSLMEEQCPYTCGYC